VNDVETRIDLAGLPIPRHLRIVQEGARTRLVVDLCTVVEARAWGAALGIELHDTDPAFHYVTQLQESGTRLFGPLIVHVCGTQSLRDEEWHARALLRVEYLRAHADPQPDPDLAAAGAAWHREHPTDCCPNQATCTECPTVVNA
jgi:hypothetical protein